MAYHCTFHLPTHGGSNSSIGFNSKFHRNGRLRLLKLSGVLKVLTNVLEIDPQTGAASTARFDYRM